MPPCCQIPVFVNAVFASQGRKNGLIVHWNPFLCQRDERRSGGSGQPSGQGFKKLIVFGL